MSLRCISFVLAVETLIRTRWSRRYEDGIGTFRTVLTFSATIMVIFLAFVMSKRLGIIYAIWAWMRRIDDRVDGMQKLPKDVASLAAYLEQKQKVVSHLDATPSFRSEDYLFLYVFQATQSLGINIEEEIQTALKLFLIDADRRVHSRTLNAKELADYVMSHDVWILVMAVKILGGDADLARRVIRLHEGIFQWANMITDMPEDIVTGMLNVPTEELAAISVTQLRAAETWRDLYAIPRFRMWHQQELARVLQRWPDAREDMRRIMPSIIPSWAARIILWRWVLKCERELMMIKSSTVLLK